MAIKDNGNGTVTIDYRDAQHRRHRQTIVGGKTLAKKIYWLKLKRILLKVHFSPI